MTKIASAPPGRFDRETWADLFDEILEGPKEDLDYRLADAAVEHIAEQVEALEYAQKSQKNWARAATHERDKRDQVMADVQLLKSRLDIIPHPQEPHVVADIAEALDALIDRNQLR